MKRNLKTIIICVAAIVSGVNSFSLPDGGATPAPPASAGEAQAKLRVTGDVFAALASGHPQDVIVELDGNDAEAVIAGLRAGAGLTHDAPGILEETRALYALVKEDAFRAMPTGGWDVMMDYSHLPMALVRVLTPEVLQALLDNPRVAAVHENGVLYPCVAQSLPLIGKPQAVVMGYKGAGATVAVLDTGADYTRSAFGSCSAPGSPGCKVILARDFAPNDNLRDDSGHGTSVAGVVVGVAPDARVAALDVFDGTSARDSDVIAAINWCIANKATYNIVAMNMSLAGRGRHTAPCGTDSLATPISSARAAGILPTVPSGNRGFANGLEAPACVPSAVSVGAVYDSAAGPVSTPACTDSVTAADRVACFSNSASFLSILAPGALIKAAGREWAGTSMAAPHVAGAAAVLTSAFPSETVDEILARMVSTGKAVSDHRNGISKPRLDLAGAVSLPGRSQVTLGNMIVDSSWKSLTFSQTLGGAPVVIFGPPTSKDDGPGVVRVRGVSAGGVDARFQEWDYRSRYFGDTDHAAENVSYLAIEAGGRTMIDGSVWQAGTFTLNGTDVWKIVSFNQSFAGAPRLFLTGQSANGASAVTVRAKNVTPGGFEAAFFEEEALMDGHTDETVGYLAVYSPSGFGTANVGGSTLPYLALEIAVNDLFTPVLAFDLRLEEEQSADSETVHSDEFVHVLAIGPHLFAQIVGVSEFDTVALRSKAPEYGRQMEWGMVHGVTHEWLQVPLVNGYSNPVVVAKSVSYNGADPGVIRLKDVQGSSFKVRYQEWTYLDGLHVAEHVFYLVAESGVQTMAGLAVEAGRLSTAGLARDGAWGLAKTCQSCELFASVQTCNGADTVTARARHEDDGSNQTYFVGLDEEEAKKDGHGAETVGWISVQNGNGTTQDGRRVQVFRDRATHIGKTVAFDNRPGSRHPVIVGDVTSYHGTDPVFLRYLSPQAAGVQVFLQEETSYDAETQHWNAEDLSFFVAD